MRSYDYANRKLAKLASEYDITTLSLRGISLDETLMTMTLSITLENISNRKAESYKKSSNAMNFMNRVFLDLFDFSPCYAIEPTEQEAETAQEHIQIMEEISRLKEEEQEAPAYAEN